MKNQATNYKSFLLRIWQEQNAGRWRASLENIVTHEKHAFPNMTSLYSFLNEQAMTEVEKNKYQVYQRKSKKIPVFIETDNELE